MFTLKIPHTVPMDRSSRDAMEERGQFTTLDDAIAAALRADLDLATAIIEKNGGQHSVNDWITFRIAGGNLGIA
jgi:hypothetical protein